MPQNLKLEKSKSKLAKPHADSVNEMADAVGEFIRYWGFKRIHGQMWTYIFLSKEPLSGADLTRAIKVSKALVSPALAELLDFKLIEYKETDGRTKKYSANPEVFNVIKSILKTRERNLIKNAQSKFEILDQNAKKNHQEIDADRLQSLGSMITSASFALEFIINSGEDGNIPDLFSLT